MKKRKWQEYRSKYSLVHEALIKPKVSVTSSVEYITQVALTTIQPNVSSANSGLFGDNFLKK